MRFLLDENIGKKVALFLQQLGHTASRVREINPGIDDYLVLELAVSKDAILITSDKDYGQLVFKERLPHTGVIFLRLQNQSSNSKIEALRMILPKYIEGKFVVVTEMSGKFKIRFAKE